MKLLGSGNYVAKILTLLYQPVNDGLPSALAKYIIYVIVWHSSPKKEWLAI